MSTQDERGVVFPAGPDGRRGTSAVGRAVVADALRPVDPAGADAASAETSWRSGYPAHFRRLVEAGMPARAAELAIATAGLAALYGRLRVRRDAAEAPLDSLLTAPADRPLSTVEVAGDAAAQKELALPYRGELLRGDALRRRLDGWAAAGVVEPSCAAAVAAVQANPDWLRLPDHTVAVLGAGAEIGPLRSLLGWGARVAAVDLPRPELWERVLGARGAGTMLVPVGAGGGHGADLGTDGPAVADWLAELPGTLVLGNYVYADGAANVRVCAAVDALTRRLQAARPDLVPAFLATPTDVFAVPAETVAHSARAYARRSVPARVVGALSAGRLLRRGYPDGPGPGVNDSMIPQQGPNYALAKRLQRWRAAVARDAGATVSLNVAPPTRTRSVLKNRALAAAYAGAHRFGVEVFEPATTNVLMAALLVHDLHTGGGPAHEHPWQDEAHAAVHGGLWRGPYAPRSALGIAAVLGYPRARA